MKRSIFVAALAICFTLSNTSSVTAQWAQKSQGLEGGRVSDFFFDGTKFFAISNPAVYYLSNNDTWNVPNQGTTFLEAKCMAGASANLFLGTSYGMFRSTDGGASWARLPQITQPVRAIVIANNKVFAGTSAGVYVSSNNGANWTLSNSGLSSDLTVWSFVYADNIIYLTTGSGVFQSSNEGASWTQIGSSTFFPPSRLIIKGNTLYVAAGGVFKSTKTGDAWSAWESMNNGLAADPGVNALYINGSELLAACKTGVYRSGDDAASWMSTSTGIPEQIAVNSFSSNGTRLFAATAVGVYTSSDNGNSWSPFNAGLTNPQVSCFVDFGDFLFAGTDAGAYVSNDNGETWKQARQGLTGTGLFVRGLAINGSKIFAATQKGMYVSSDNGASWNYKSTGLPVNYLINAVTNHHGIIYVALIRSGVPGRDLIYASADGDSWNLANGNLPAATDASAITSANGSLYVAVDGSVYKSTDDGSTWNLSRSGNTFIRISTMLSHGTDLYFVSSQGLFRTTDAGVQWTRLDAGLATPNITSLVVSESEIFLGSSLTTEIIRWSSDNGASFKTANAGLTTNTIYALHLHNDNIFGALYGNKSVWSRPLTDFAFKITSVSPIKGAASTVVTINGNNFDPVATGNTVTFNGVPAVVISSTTTTLTVAVPATATTGKISVTALGQTATSDDDFTIEESVTAVETGADMNALMSVYPNPADKNLFIDMGSTGITQFTIYNAMGHAVSQLQQSAGDGPIDVSALSPGCYVIRASDNQKTWHKRFIKR